MIFIKYVQDVVNSGGEGAIVREPLSLYEHGKSTSLLKVKNMIDAEALVVDFTGTHYVCALPNGDMICATNKYNFLIKNGDLITFTKTSSQNCRKIDTHIIVSVRHDLLWSDVVNQYFVK